MSPARSSEAAAAIVERYAPTNADPKPPPATAVPTKSTAGAPVAIEANVNKAPTISVTQPPSIAAAGLFLATTAEAAAPNPVSRKIRAPPQSRFRECSSCKASDGPSER
jgi:hypothetical protein